jgi:hypothetical protein
VIWRSTVGTELISAAICPRVTSLQRGWGGGGVAPDALCEPHTCRQYVSAQVRRVSDGSSVFAREFGPEDMRGKAYEANLSGLAWDFARAALDL